MKLLTTSFIFFFYASCSNLTTLETARKHNIGPQEPYGYGYQSENQKYYKKNKSHCAILTKLTSHSKDNKKMNCTRINSHNFIGRQYFLCCPSDGTVKKEQ